MAIEKTFKELRAGLQRLQEALEAVSTIVEQDKPARGEVVVATKLSDALLAIRGTLEESRAAAEDGELAVGHPLDIDRARRALTACQERFHLFANRFVAELLSYEALTDLMSVGRERGRQWLSWTTVVKESLEQSGSLLNDVRDELFLCWQELAERIGMTSVSVQTTAIGQQISASDLASRDLVREGVT
jgi:hypothetical protein